MGKYSETRYANMIPTFEPAPLPASEAAAAQKSNMRVYETIADLPATSTSKGNTAFVKATNKLYIWNGVGWYLVAEVTNASPSSITGVNSAYSLASDGTATTITAVATDPEGFALTWSSSVTAGSLNGTTVSNVDNVFTVTPHASNATTFTLTFSVTDGATGAVNAVSAFTLAFAPVQIGSDTIYTTGSGTYSIPSGANYVKVFVTGGGAGAGGATGFAGKSHSGGGGAGGTAIGYLAVTAGQNITYTVGGGGNGGGYTNNGGPGASSTLNYNGTDFAIGNGGSTPTGVGSSSQPQTGGTGGSATHTGMVSIALQNGGNGGNSSGPNIGGAGGTSYYGVGGAGGPENGTAADPSHYGAGGGGAGSNAAAYRYGADGAGGYIVIQAWTMTPP